MELLYVDRHPNGDLEAIGGRRVGLPTCLARADFVTLHTSLSDDTRHLIGAEELKLMKPTAVLINTARGPVVEKMPSQPPCGTAESQPPGWTFTNTSRT